MSEQYNSLNEKTKLIDLSLKYTGGDMNKAKAMASGQYLDVIVVAGKFAVEETGQSGMFFISVNTFDEYIAKVFTLLKDDPGLFDKVRIFDDWKSLYNDALFYSKEPDTVNSDQLSDHILDSSISTDIFAEVQDEDLAGLIRKINSMLQNYFNVPSVLCQINLNKTSSLAMELAGITIDVPEREAPEEEKPEEHIEEIITEEDKRIRKIEEEANYIVNGSIIVSPVSGKYINDIEIGEMIKVILPGKDPVTRKLIDVLNAKNEEGEIRPVKGRLKAKVPLEKSGYILYTLIAKGVLAKIVEEENVKIQIEAGVKEIQKESKRDSRLLLMLAILIGLVIVAGIILINVL